MIGIEISDAEIRDLRKVEARDSQLSNTIHGLILRAHLLVERAIILGQIQDIMIEIHNGIYSAFINCEEITEHDAERFTEIFWSHLYDICLKGMHEKGIMSIPADSNQIFADSALDQAFSEILPQEEDLSDHPTS